MSDKARVIRSDSGAKAGIYIQEDAVSIIGDKDNFIVADDRGITIKGAVSFVSDSMNRRTAGLFVGLNDFFEMIPQTIITPVPSKVPMPPVFALASIARDVAFFTALLV